ncbi:nuclease [Thermosulfurimonas marina]|uniref:Nuclease n=1 Tax=Thermosulfurimonas marina TaxID=2047767 RepID=A0A6H1WSN9_9BACT|nr:thermonuclease family protein [Thermosulfurimonas marina]QJA06202.1 nuclease [Thermosulfurimonas marina]
MKDLRLRLFLLGILLLWVGWARALEVTVVRALDGDTVVLSDGKRLRYAGIDAPELHRKEGPPEPLAREAWLLNRQLVEGRRLRFEPAARRRDRYGRLLGYLFLPDGRLVSEVLVSRGLAFACFWPGAARYREHLLAVQREALAKGRGIFGVLRDTDPYYVGNRASRRFHRPHCPHAQHIRRKILFHSLYEALYAGYCPARGCRPGFP